MPYHLGEGLELEEKGIRPYALWFEYLKLALDDPKLTVDTNFYAPWGNIRDTKFDDWWKAKGAELFAVPLSVAIINSSQEAEIALEHQNVLVRIVKGTPLREIIEKISEIHPDKIAVAYNNIREQMAMFSLTYKKKSNNSCSSRHADGFEILSHAL